MDCTLETATAEAAPLFHEAANLFPMMTAEEFTGLLDDMQKHGQKEPVLYHRGKIIDGRNRYIACKVLGIQCSEAELDDDDDPFAWVVSLNLHRRHLDESQRAMIAAKLATLADGQTKKQGSSIELPAVSQSDAAKLLNVSVASVKRAKVVIESGKPELIAAVDAGEVAVSKAAKIAKPKPEPVDAEPDDSDYGRLPPQEFEPGIAAAAEPGADHEDNPVGWVMGQLELVKDELIRLNWLMGEGMREFVNQTITWEALVEHGYPALDAKITEQHLRYQARMLELRDWLNGVQAAAEVRVKELEAAQ